MFKHSEMLEGVFNIFLYLLKEWKKKISNLSRNAHIINPRSKLGRNDYLIPYIPHKLPHLKQT